MWVIPPIDWKRRTEGGVVVDKTFQFISEAACGRPGGRLVGISSSWPVSALVKVGQVLQQLEVGVGLASCGQITISFRGM